MSLSECNDYSQVAKDQNLFNFEIQIFDNMGLCDALVWISLNLRLKLHPHFQGSRYD